MLPGTILEPEQPTKMSPAAEGLIAPEPERTILGLIDPVPEDGGSEFGMDASGPTGSLEPGGRRCAVVTPRCPEVTLARHKERHRSVYQPILHAVADPLCSIAAHHTAVPRHKPLHPIGRLALEVQPLVGCPLGCANTQPDRLLPQTGDPQRTIGCL